MCGIAGICALRPGHPPDVRDIHRMMAQLRHRGPDESGIYLDDGIGLGHMRLSIIDLEGGGQPVHNEDETLWIIYNGEIFNYLELRRQLQDQGHRFYTTSDTEVLLHLYEQEGIRCLERVNGQFAFAIWDRVKKVLFLARDRMGIRPLHYALHDGRLLFASEIKAIFALGGVRRELDPRALDQIFTFWTVLPGQTAFRDIHELPAGHYLLVSAGVVEMKKYWEIPICPREEQLDLPLETICGQVTDLLVDAIRIRLRADVPVGCYVSGGLDSSGMAALATQRLGVHWNSFGIRFEDQVFDEGTHQEKMAAYLGSTHRQIWATPERIGNALAQTLWHCEKPLLRTAPVPLQLLSQFVHECGLKVVLTGEGADEVFGGYDLFKEAKVRQFWSRRPRSPAAALLLGQLYEDIFRDRRARGLLLPFFRQGLNRSADPLFSHLLRWDNTGRIKTFFSAELKGALGTADPYEPVRQSLPQRFVELDVVGKAQYLEMLIFLGNYLLSSQGDRVAMAHSVETRLPFLDYRIVEFMARVPSRRKIAGLKEKHVLKRVFQPVLPPEIVARRKQPYRAPILPCLATGPGGEYARERLTHRAIRRAALFDADKVDRLLEKLRTAKHASEMDGMALAGILSSQIIHHQFVENFTPCGSSALRPDRIIDRRRNARVAV